jgi:hypothetical protein
MELLCDVALYKPIIIAEKISSKPNTTSNSIDIYVDNGGRFGKKLRTTYAAQALTIIAMTSTDTTISMSSVRQFRLIILVQPHYHPFTPPRTTVVLNLG